MEKKFGLVFRRATNHQRAKIVATLTAAAQIVVPTPQARLRLLQLKRSLKIRSLMLGLISKAILLAVHEINRLD